MYKIVLLGSSGVGKTSIAVRFTKDEFTYDQMTTIGVDFRTKEIPSRKCVLNIWDTAGQEAFRSLIRSYYRGCVGYILVYDVTRYDTFADLQYWLDEIAKYKTHTDAVLVIVGNKIDLLKHNVVRGVDNDLALAFAQQHNAHYLECSCSTNIGVARIFNDLLTQILDNPSLANYPLQLDNISIRAANETHTTCANAYC